MSFEDKVRNLLSKSKFWQSVGSVSNVGGMACLALSPSFQRLIGKWYKWEIFAHVVLTVILTRFMFFADEGPSSKESKRSSKESKRFWCLSFSTGKILIPSCVLIFSNVGSYYYDKAIGGKPDALGVISMGLLALSAVSLSRLINVGFEVGFFNFFLALFVIELVQIHWWLVVVGAIFCFLAIAARVYSEESPAEGDEKLEIVVHPASRTSLNQRENSVNGYSNRGSGVEKGEEPKEPMGEEKREESKEPEMEKKEEPENKEEPEPPQLPAVVRKAPPVAPKLKLEEPEEHRKEPKTEEYVGLIRRTPKNRIRTHRRDS